MPTWNETHIEERGRWLFRVQDAVHWDADFPGVGSWTNKRWWKLKPPEGRKFTLGNTGAAKTADPVITRQQYPGFVSVGLPGVLRVAYPQFIHYEFYVPIDADTHRYVGVMVQFKTGVRGLWYKLRYALGGSAGCSTATSPTRTRGWSSRWMHHPSVCTAPTCH